MPAAAPPVIAEPDTVTAPATGAAGGDAASITPAPRESWPWWWIGAALAAVAAGAFLLLRRRAAAASEAEAQYPEPETEAMPLPVEPPPVEPLPVEPKPAPAAAADTIDEPVAPRAAASGANRASGEINFQPVALRLSLVYATLQFRMALTAATVFPAGRLLGDMISAHGSLSQDQQLFPPAHELPLMQEFRRLSPGETLEVTGELRLPLNAIRPVQQGGAAFMVPLVRLALVGDDEPGLPHLELGCVFTIGLPGNGPALAPLRLDTGPRDFAGLAGREIEAARRTSLASAFAGLDPARAAG